MTDSRKTRRRRCHAALCGEFWSSLPGPPSAPCLCVTLAALSGPSSVRFGDCFRANSATNKRASPSTLDQTVAKIRESLSNEEVIIFFCFAHQSAHLVHKTILNTIIFACQLKSLCNVSSSGLSLRASVCDTCSFRQAVLHLSFLLFKHLRSGGHGTPSGFPRLLGASSLVQG